MKKATGSKVQSELVEVSEMPTEQADGAASSEAASLSRVAEAQAKAQSNGAKLLDGADVVRIFPYAEPFNFKWTVRGEDGKFSPRSVRVYGSAMVSGKYAGTKDNVKVAYVTKDGFVPVVVEVNPLTWDKRAVKDGAYVVSSNWVAALCARASKFVKGEDGRMPAFVSPFKSTGEALTARDLVPAR